ncbi:phospholipase A1-Ibeta2, chloroplastic-like [Macadamia integrifolia]|uniref:phospholipase A1-Ibeta2, chloroplastic-like n=1 Tax=Macadamia integrifolia TaxID=60698 RepID=UPI001C4EE32A|nr:phospholipase A1-Ibeta2, chloroplastic-like [Macadamia integrifolia]
MIASTIPTQNGLSFQAFRSTSISRCGSRLNPLIRATSASTQTLTTESSRKHLSNLDKLLHQQAPSLPQQDSTPLQNDSFNGSSPEKRVNHLFQGLNLSRIWPEMKAAEEISPRHLNRLQRLLSKSHEYSPRNNLGSRWREYHGSNDWVGLIDPLDENLRREVVRFGEFIQAAYHAFHSNPATSDEVPPSPHHVAVPDRSYKVTKDLYATSSIGLPSWVDDLAPNLGWMTQRSSWIGYVAVCDDKSEISRMGRRDIVISLRGTATCLEWAENMRDVLVRVPGKENSGRNQPVKVECGFQSLYKTPGSNMPSLAESVMEEVRRLMNLYKGETLSITVTGHSLGAALALLIADELSTCEPDMPPIAVFSFGGPRVGNRTFGDQVTKNGVKVLRIVNSQDVITRVPGMFVSEELDQKLRDNSKVAGVLNVLDNMPWAYSHVGAELRVDSKMSPYLKPDADVGCCHDLEAYLHLVDGFMGTNSPFRANAKRSLARLVNEQKSNVKKLYISKAKDLNIEKQAVAIPSCLPSPS